MRRQVSQSCVLLVMTGSGWLTPAVVRNIRVVYCDLIGMTDDATPPPSAPAVPAPALPAASARRARLRELSPKTMWLTAAVVVVLTAGAVVVLWWPATAGLNGAELVTAR